MTPYSETESYQAQREIQWLLSHATWDDARVFVYSRSERDAMIAEGHQRRMNGLCYRWNVGRRGWEFSLIS